MSSLDAVFIFCEGEHDVAFCHLVLKHVLCFEHMQIPEVCAPSPLGNMLQKYQLMRAENKLCPAPVFRHYYRHEDRGVFVFKTGGKDNVDSVKGFVGKLLGYLPTGEFANLGLSQKPGEGPSDRIGAARFLFVYDDDEKTFDELEHWWKGYYSALEKCPAWKIASERELVGANGAIYGDKALYGWFVDAQTNTLEDLLTSVFEECTDFPIAKCRQFVMTDSGWLWDPASAKPKDVAAANARRGKAMLTIAGQHQRPGCALSAIVHDCLQDGHAKRDDEERVKRFRENKYAKGFGDFLRKFVGL